MSAPQPPFDPWQAPQPPFDPRRGPLPPLEPRQVPHPPFDPRQPPMPPGGDRGSGLELFGIIAGAVLTVVAGLPMLLFIDVVVQAHFGPPREDPHGYPELFGSVIAVMLSGPTSSGLIILIVCAVLRRQRKRRRMAQQSYDDRLHP